MRQFVDTIVAWGPGGLAILAALDSAGIPIPAAVDAVLLLLSAASPEQAALCAALALVGSLAGSMFLFWLSRRGGEAYLARHTVSSRGIKMRTWFQHYGLLTVFITAVSPVPMPMKLFVISAGALGVRPLSFFLTLVCARVPRYAALAYLGTHLGEDGALVYLKAHAWQIGGILVALFALFYCAIKFADSRRMALLTMMCVYAGFAQPARSERLKLSAGDFYSAESILEVHRLEKGEDAEYMEGLAWVTRGAALVGHWDAAAVHAAKLRKISGNASYGHGTAIEVEAQILAASGKKKEALGQLEEELKQNAAAPVAFRSRIQKRWNQIGLVGLPAPDLDGSLKDLRGRAVVLFLWAEWCGDCKAQAPAFVNIVNKYAPRGVAFLAPTRVYDKDREAEKKRIDEQRRTIYKTASEVPAPIGDEAMLRYGASATPTFVVIDKKGIVTFYSPTRLTEQRLASEIEKALR